MIRRGNSVKMIRRETQKTSSAPAIKKMLESGSFFWVLFWLAVLAAAPKRAGTTVGLYYHLSYAIDLYKETPINTEVMQVATSILEFPAHSFCRPMLPFSAERIETLEAVPGWSQLNGKSLGTYKFEMLLYLYALVDNGYAYRNIIYTLNNLMVEEEVVDIFNISMYSLIPDVLQYCDFNGYRCDFRHFKHYVHPVYHDCYTFDLGVFLAAEPKSARVGEAVVLTIIINDESGRGVSVSNAKMLITEPYVLMQTHIPNTRPTMTSNYEIERGGRWAQAAVTRVETQKLNLQHKPCFQEDPNMVYEIVPRLSDLSASEIDYDSRFGRFTRDECMTDETQKIFLNRCGCLSPLDDVSRSVIEFAQGRNRSQLIWCHQNNFHANFSHFFAMNGYVQGDNVLVEYYTDLNSYNEYRPAGRLNDLLNGSETAQRFNCFVKNYGSKDIVVETNRRCPSFCAQTSFETRYSYIDYREELDMHPGFRSLLAKQEERTKELLAASTGLWSNYSLDRDFATFSQRYSILMRFRYDVMQKRLVQEQETYPLINLCSNVGGTLGLWIGVSALVLAEVLVVIRTVISSCRGDDEAPENVATLRKSKKTRTYHLRRFALSTSIHGVNHLILSSQRRSRWLWLLVMVLCCFGLAFHCQMMIQAFTEGPISTETRFNLDKEQVPQFTFCPQNVQSDYLLLRANLEVDWRQLRNINLRQFHHLTLHPVWSEIFRMLLNSSDSFHDSTTQQLKDALIKHSLYTLLKELQLVNISRLQSYTSVFKCEYSLQSCNFNNFRFLFHPVYKFCFSFDFLGSSSRVGAPEELIVLLTTGDIFSRVRFGNGSAVFSNNGGVYEMHPWGTYPSMKRHYDYNSFVVHLAEVIKVITDVVPSTQFPCVADRETVELLEDDFLDGWRSREYLVSVELCGQLRLQSEVLHRCSCLSTMLPLSAQLHRPSTSPFCSLLPSTVFGEAVSVYQQQYTLMAVVGPQSQLMTLHKYLQERLSSEFWGQLQCQRNILTNSSLIVELESACHSLCHKVDFSLTVKSIWKWYYNSFPTNKFSDEYAADIAAINGSQPLLLHQSVRATNNKGRYLSSLYFYFKTAEVKQLVETYSYTLVNFISDLGGILGLWFGFSVASIFEVIELGFALIWST